MRRPPPKKKKTSRMDFYPKRWKSNHCATNRSPLFCGSIEQKICLGPDLSADADADVEIVSDRNRKKTSATIYRDCDFFLFR